MRTFRRDVLLRLAQAGKLVAVGSYHYDEMTGGKLKTGIRKPVRVISPGQGADGFFNVFESDFKSHTGYACLERDGKQAHLQVHGNYAYDFERSDGEAFGGKPPASQRGKLPCNVRMQDFLKSHGIEATVKYIADGSLRGSWRMYNHEIPWDQIMADKLNALGFKDLHLEPFGPYSGNGGVFSVFARGHDELLKEPVCNAPNATSL